jgi:deoxyribonuclease V
MLACVDVHYRADRAKVACLTFDSWQSDAPDSAYTSVIEHPREYIPGQFYKRELPCILDILGKVRAHITLLVVDGYVWLDRKRTPGLGAHLYDALHGRIAIIGVAKNPYQRAPHAKKVFRGASEKPLYVTSAGISLAQAAKNVRIMHGDYRIPTLLKLVDQLSRQNDSFH